jgi:sugar phosphate isomerase/epimerase
MVLMAPLVQAAATTLLAADKKAKGTSAKTPGKMTLCLHQNTSLGAGYRKSLEGWARAGVKQVELVSSMLDEFLKTDTLAAARKVVSDAGLTAVSCSPGLTDFWNPHPNHAAMVETFKRRAEQYATFGIQHIYNPANSTTKIARDDYKAGLDIIRETGDIAKQFGMVASIEFTRASGYISNLRTCVQQIRAAGHANVKVLLDCYHFWSGPSKLEDMDLLQKGDIAHVHFQDTPDTPRELYDNTTRLIPGDGVSPLTKILQKIQATGYAGPLSVELFLPEFQQGDPYEVAKKIREKSEHVMQLAKVGRIPALTERGYNSGVNQGILAARP